jgi:hypothetical protein
MTFAQMSGRSSRPLIFHFSAVTLSRAASMNGGNRNAAPVYLRASLLPPSSADDGDGTCGCSPAGSRGPPEELSARR